MGWPLGRAAISGIRMFGVTKPQSRRQILILVDHLLWRVCDWTAIVHSSHLLGCKEKHGETAFHNTRPVQIMKDIVLKHL